MVLKKTMGHLLSLLERDHEDDLLAVHSFLWDRMRAVRMDLRMQHIFTKDAIAMHEQMVCTPLFKLFIWPSQYRFASPVVVIVQHVWEVVPF